MEISKINDFLGNHDNEHGYGKGCNNSNGYGDDYQYGKYDHGYGCSNNDDYNYGNGDGCDYGDGWGFNYSNGFGDNYGDGDGCGDGGRYTNGDGYNDGYGNNYGSSGGGSGIKSINGDLISRIDNMPTIIKLIHGNVAKGYMLGSGLKLTPCYIVKCNGYFAHGDTLQDAMQSLEEKIYADIDTEEAIKMFLDKFELNKKYPNTEFFKWHNILTGSCRFGREQFAKEHNIDVENGKMTVEEFIELTKNAYGGSVIKELKDKIQEM